LALDGGKWLASCPEHFILGEETLVPPEEEDGWTPEVV